MNKLNNLILQINKKVMANGDGKIIMIVLFKKIIIKKKNFQ